MNTGKRLFGVLMATLSVAVAVLMLACSAPDDGGGNGDGDGDGGEAKVTGIVVSLTGATFIEKDETVTLTVEVKGTGDYDKAVTWKSDKEAIATVKDGKVTGIAAGEATITATSVADTAISGTLKVEVKESYVDTVTIDGGNLELNAGTKKILTATVTVEGSLSDTEKRITWSSDKPEIASIDADSGELEAKAEGTAQIRATAGGVSSMPISVKVLFVESVTFSISYNNKEYRASKILDVNANENSNIVNIFIDEDYKADSPLNLKVTPTLPTGWTTTLDPAVEYNFSDQTADIFDISDGTTTGKFRLNIFRKPILVDTKPAGNTDTTFVAPVTSVAIQKFVQTDYYYVPSAINEVLTGNPAPSFVLYGKDANPTTDEILSSPVRILRNFITDDGTTLFFTITDDGVREAGATEEELWLKDYGFKGEDRFLQPGTDYSLHWAVDASNGKFKGKYEGIATASKPSTGDLPANLVIATFGGMEIHPIQGNNRISVLGVGVGSSGRLTTGWTDPPTGEVVDTSKYEGNERADIQHHFFDQFIVSRLIVSTPVTQKYEEYDNKSFTFKYGLPSRTSPPVEFKYEGKE